MHKRKEYRDSTPMIQYDRWGWLKLLRGAFFGFLGASGSLLHSLENSNLSHKQYVSLFTYKYLYPPGLH